MEYKTFNFLVFLVINVFFRWQVRFFIFAAVIIIISRKNNHLGLHCALNFLFSYRIDQVLCLRPCKVQNISAVFNLSVALSLI